MEPLKVAPAVPLKVDPLVCPNWPACSDGLVCPNGLTNTHGVVDEVLGPKLHDIIAEALKELGSNEEDIIEGVVFMPVLESVEVGMVDISKHS